MEGVGDTVKTVPLALHVCWTCVSVLLQDKLLRRSVLLLAVCLGQEKLTLSPYQSGPISLPTTSIDHLPFSLRLSDLVNKKKVSGLDAVERFLWVRCFLYTCKKCKSL